MYNTYQKSVVCRDGILKDFLFTKIQNGRHHIYSKKTNYAYVNIHKKIDYGNLLAHAKFGTVYQLLLIINRVMEL